MLRPSHFDTSTKWVPAESRSVAKVWRRSWSRTPSPLAPSYRPRGSWLACSLAALPGRQGGAEHVHVERARAYRLREVQRRDGRPSGRPAARLPR